MHADDTPSTSWKTGHLAVELPATFAASPVTPAESAKWLEECRRSMPVMLQHIAPDAPFFEYVKKERDVDIWKGDVPDSPFKLIRGKCQIPASYDEIMVNMTCPTTENFNRSMRTVDEMFNCGRSLHTIAGRGAQQDEFGNVTSRPELPYASLRWSSFNAPWPLWGRDFVFVQYVDEVVHDGDRIAITLSFSVDKADAPKLEDSHKFVRAAILETGYIARERKGVPGLELTYCVRVDTAGVIPIWLQNLAAPAQALNCARTRSAFGGRRAAEAAFEAAGGAFRSAHFAGCVSHYFRVTPSDGLKVPISPKAVGTEVHFALLATDGDNLSFVVSSKSGPGKAPVDFRAATFLKRGSIFEGSFVVEAGTAYELNVRNGGRDHVHLGLKVLAHPHGLPGHTGDATAAAGGSVPESK